MTYIYIYHIVNIDNHLWEVSELEIDEKKASAVFKAFCDENRIKILKLLVTGEKCACELNEKIDVSQPTMSHHMKILCDSGVVLGRREGKWTYYSISSEGVFFALRTLHALTGKKLS
ncbi:ArsR family transcriptional regulator [Hungatella hathewayi]|nr:ArsR family transcriptional regulator [Hungatella hathewayi]